jgi:hypothetical protein
MFRKSLCAVVPAVLLSACAAPVYNYQPQSMAISEPPIGTVNTSTVGDVMLRQGKYKEHDAIFVGSQANAGWAYTLYPGYYLKQGENDGSEFFYPGGGDEAGRVGKSWIADPWKSVMTKKDSTDLCMVTVLNAYACSSGQQFEKRKKPVLSQDSFQQTLIYSGRVGNKINIGYREFSNSLARPAFNNNVEYDLSESNLIGYKGAQLEIIEATNQLIKYKVLRNFNDATH